MPVIRVVVSSAGETPARSTTRETPALTMNSRAPSPTSRKPETGAAVRHGVILPEHGGSPSRRGGRIDVVNFLVRVVVNALALGVAAWLLEGIGSKVARPPSRS